MKYNFINQIVESSKDVTIYIFKFLKLASNNEQKYLK